ncbi:uncharacterized protein RSE6_02915 [Rhynchosporium secalis]|uniref:DUF6590 domain-containing protein n=1 Tax=Rhynchosporium secalis TaxID=38038 RepID=A0A1E1M1F3_RHYSE|nr:uncharacterized protein RSE6_02915 [Rhynchosporium secalis]
MSCSARLGGLKAKLETERQDKANTANATVVLTSVSTIWQQKAVARYGSENPGVPQQRATSVANISAPYKHAGNAKGGSSRPASTLGMGGLSVNNGRINQPTGGGAMRAVYANTSQVMRPQPSIGAMNQRPTDAFHPKAAFQPGVIFSAVTHEHHYRQDRVDNTNANQTETNFGVTNSKFRKFVILACFENHVIALPILTHQGRGLSSKRNKHEFVSVRERSLEGIAAPSESKHAILWAELYPGFQKASAWHRMTDQCCLHFTKPYSHNIEHKCTISGKLENASTNRLQKLFQDAVINKAAGGGTNRAEFQTPLTSLQQSPTTPRGHTFPSQQAPITGTGYRQTNIWSSTRSNLSQSSISVR